jgi:hypothetical protein
VRVTHMVVYDQLISGVTPTYSPSELNESLARLNLWTVFTVASRTTGTSPTLDIAVESSPDGSTWSQLYGPLRNPIVLSLSDTTATVNSWKGGGYFRHSIGSKFTRLRFTLAGTTPTTTLKAWVTGRSDAIHHYVVGG